MASLQCHSCGAPVPYDEPIGRSLTCEKCGADLRSCINCRHYDTRYNNACTEPQADLVEDKTRGNFCEYFYFSRTPFTGVPADRSRAADARARLADLFKPAGEATPPGSTPSTREATAREKLDALFRKKPDGGTSS
jgi:predicted RNA-binding Zn-ribbon protein involved in translation (DUF1610 family)